MGGFQLVVDGYLVVAVGGFRCGLLCIGGWVRFDTTMGFDGLGSP